jgi:HK97 family phage major capsid protein
MNYQEQITLFQQQRNEKQSQREDMVALAAGEARTLDDDELRVNKSLTDDIKRIDEHLAILRDLAGEEAPEVKSAPVSRSKTPNILVRKQDKDDEFAGQSFTRCVIAQALAEMSGFRKTAGQIAEERWGKNHPTLVQVIKAGIPGGSAYGVGSDSWGMELVTADNRYTGDFIEYLAGMTVYDRLALRSVPANVLIKGQEGIGQGYWVGEKKAIPMSAMDFMDVELRHLKVAALSVVSVEWMKFADPAGERLVRDSLAEASAQRTDTTFFSAAAAVTGVSPAGMLNGVSGISSNGADADGLRADIAELYAPFLAAKNASNLAFVCNPSLAKSISLMRNALGQREFPDLNAMGGTLEGDPVMSGDNINGSHLILLKPSDIWRIGETGVEVSLSRDATIEMDSAPVGDGSVPTAGTASAVSMFQTEQIAFKVVRPINFAKRRGHAVQYVDDAAYSPNPA